MTERLAAPGEMVDVHPAGPAVQARRQTTLVTTNDVQVTQIIIPAGESVPTYEAEGEIILHCLKGRISLTALGQDHELAAGQLLYLGVNEPFSMRAIEQASVLATIVAPRQGARTELIGRNRPA